MIIEESSKHEEKNLVSSLLRLEMSTISGPFSRAGFALQQTTQGLVILRESNGQSSGRKGSLQPDSC